MKKISHTHKILIVAVFFAFISLSLYGFLFWQVKSENEKASTLLQEAEQDIEKEKTLRAAKISLEKNETLIKAIDTYFIPRDGVVPFIEELEKLGKDSGVMLSVGAVSTEVDPKVKDDFKETLRLRLETTGSWKDTFYFLSLIESLPYRAQVEQIALSLSGASDSLNFGNETKRTPNKNESWKGIFDVTILKMR